MNVVLHREEKKGEERGERREERGERRGQWGKGKRGQVRMRRRRHEGA